MGKTRRRSECRLNRKVGRGVLLSEH